MSTPLNLLMIEDSEDDALLIVRELRRDGFDLIWERVETAAEFQTALVGSNWDVIISDYRLPGFDAPAALEIAQQHQIDIPFIVVSGTVGEASAVAMMKAGAHDYVMKGNLTRLPEAIRRAIREVSVQRERARTKMELDLTKERLQLAINGSGVGLWDWYVQTGDMIVNERWAEMIGYTLPELEPIQIETWTKYMHPEDLLKSNQVIDRHFQGETQIYECEIRMRHRSDAWIWVLVRGKVVEQDASGKPLRMTGTQMDITDRKQAHEALNQLNYELENRVGQRTAELQASEARNQAILEAIPDLLMRLGRDGRCLDYIQPGSRAGNFLPTINHLSEVLPPELLKQQIRMIERAIETGELQVYEHQFLKQNCMVYEEVRVVAINHEEVLAIVRDISARKQAEIQLQKTNAELTRATRLKDEFLASMSHELRTPLTSILGLSDVLQEEVYGALNEKQRQYIEVIAQSGKHLLSLINDILDLAKIESGKLELQIAPAAVESLCISSMSFVQQIAQEKSIQLNMQILTDIEEINVDELRIRQVLINLLSNAVKFTPEGGQVTLEVRRDRAHVMEFSVIDTGIGIAPEDMPKLFQSFVQIDSSLSRHYSGTGLGLALVKQIIEMHQGAVAVESKLGQGSCFTISLPYYGEPGTLKGQEHNTGSALPLADLAEQQHSAESRLILLAEDNQANIDTFSNYLSSHGYRLLIALNGQEAVTLAQSHQPDVILMDIQMPGMDGLEATRIIRNSLELNTPIIALTALAMPGDRERCLSAGANEYLMKPVKLKHLLATIQNCC